MEATCVTHVGVCVRDMEKSLKFYRDALGMKVIGEKITELTPSRGFSATLAAAITTVVASRMGIPVSTTHILVGSVFGVGLARGIGALDLGVVGRIMISWVATLPIAAALSIAFFYFFKGFLS